MSNDWEKNYDNWKLATPWDNEPDIEVFKAEKYNYYTTDYDTVVNFDLQMLEAKKLGHIGYETKEDFLEDFAENLADELNLHFYEDSAIEEYYERKN